MEKGKCICVFLSSKDLPEPITKECLKFAELLGKKGYTLVWGGVDMGLMGDVARTAQKNGAVLMGLVPERLSDYTYQTAHFSIPVKDVAERKTLMITSGAAFVVLPGGIGTLDEFIYTLEMKKPGSHDKPIVVLNIQGFFDSFYEQLARINEAGAYNGEPRSLFVSVNTAEEVFEYLEALEPA